MGRWEETEKNRGRGNSNQDMREKNLFLIEEGKVIKSWNSYRKIMEG